jgi:pimeloyl-ACP methyl ester carboxylesterase
VRVDEHTIELAGTPVFFRHAPSDATPVLYLHGVPTSADDWTPFLERTGGIAPDLPGFGRTGKGGHLAYSPASHADFIEVLLDHLDTRRVRLVMNGWGAAGGLVFAQRDPGRVEALVLVNALPLLSGYRYPRIGRVWRTQGIGEFVMGMVGRRVLARALRQGTVREDAWPQERVDAVWRQFDQGTQRAILRLHRSASEDQLAQAGLDLPELDAPALVVWGARDPWIPAPFGQRYADVLHAELHTLPDAGHWPWLDRPDAIDLIASFLEHT